MRTGNDLQAPRAIPGRTTFGTPTDQRRVVGTRGGPERAAQAREGLAAAGFTPEQGAPVAVAAPATQPPRGNTEPGRARETALGGAFVGGVAGWLVGISALVLPGIGPIVGAGIIVPTLAGAGLGAVAGRLIGAPGEEAAAREGSVLLPAPDTRPYRAPAQ